ncbi:hypothetical protein GCM10027074_10280 [Streptomyces deserti]
MRPFSRTAPSIWYAEVAAPQRKAEGKVTGVTGFSESGMEALPLVVVGDRRMKGGGERKGREGRGREGKGGEGKGAEAAVTRPP